MERISELILKAIREELSDPERAELDLWLAGDPLRRGLVEELMDPQYMGRQLEILDSYEEDAIWNKIREGEREMPEIGRGGSGRRRWLVRVAAAAVVLGLVWTVGYRMLHREGSADHGLAGKPVAGETKQTPVRDRAVLTLDDGRQIALDSAADGTLAQQGGAAIVKQAGGELVYQDAGQNKDKVYYNRMETPLGGQYRLVLPDGTRVWLNAASSIRYPNLFTGGQRIVQVKGEAYFEVAKDAGHPFIVETEGMKVEVLGTAFNLMAYQDEDAIRTTLINGAVRVSAGPVSREIAPGQQAVLGQVPQTGAGTGQGAGPGQASFRVSQVDVEEVIGWKEGEFRFRQTDLPAILRQIRRWYPAEVRQLGELSQVRLSGIISRSQSLAQLVEILDATGKAHFELDGDTIRVSPVKK